VLKSIPESPQAVTAEWLSKALSRHKEITRAGIKAVQVNALQDLDGSVGQMARINLDYSQVSDDVPSSLIGKFSTTNPVIRDLANKAGLYKREIYFFEANGSDDLPIPRCYYGAVDTDTGASLLLLEDLGHYQISDIVKGASSSEAEGVMDCLATLHAKWWDNPKLESMPWLPPFNQNIQLMRSLIKWEAVLQHVKSSLPDFQLADSFLEVVQNFDHYLKPFSNHFTKSPLTCIHCDLHLDNLLFSASQDEPPIMMIDWQFVAQGRGITDIAYFMIRSISPEQRRKTEHSLVKRYHDSLVKKGVNNYSFDDCWAEYQHAFFWPFMVVLAAVSTGGKAFVSNPERFKVTLERLTAFIEDHKVRERYISEKVLI